MKNNLEKAQDIVGYLHAKSTTTFWTDENKLLLATCCAAVAQAEIAERQAAALEKIAKSIEETNSNISRMTLY